MTRNVRLARLAGLFYEAAFDPGRTGAAMDGLRSVTGEAMCAFGTVSGARGMEFFHGDCAAEYHALFFDPRLANPVLPLLTDTGRTEVIRNDDLMPSDEFRRTPFFNEWLLRQQATSLAVLKAPLGGGGSMLLTLHRGGDPREAGASFGPRRSMS